VRLMPRPKVTRKKATVMPVEWRGAERAAPWMCAFAYAATKQKGDLAARLYRTPCHARTDQLSRLTGQTEGDLPSGWPECGKPRPGSTQVKIRRNGSQCQWRRFRDG
jgi:hypothetical protein